MCVCVRDVDGTKAFKLEKNRTIDQLFLGEFKKSSLDRPIAKTTIIETIRHLKDDAVHKALGFKSEQPRFRYGRDATAKLLTLEDEFGTINIPGIAGQDPFDMKVVMNKPNNDLFVELTTHVLDYLKVVMRVQYREYSAPVRTSGKVQSELHLLGKANMCYSKKHGRDCIRTYVKDDQGKMHTKFIKIDDHGGGVARAADQAQDWQEEKRSSLGSSRPEVESDTLSDNDMS